MNTLNDNHQSPYFLATTALEEFWDTSKPLLFLGEWCRRHSRQAFWEPLEGKVLISPWHDTPQLHQAYHYIVDLHERLLPVLKNPLNSIHRVNFSTRYWRIVLGPWLLYYLPIIYDRYRCLRSAFNDYPSLTTTVLAEESWITPCDTTEFVQLIYHDSYNLQLYSRILKLSGYDFPEMTFSVAPMPVVSSERNIPGWKTLWKKFLVNKLTGVNQWCKADRSIILRNSYFSPRVKLQLFLKTFGRIWPVLNRLTPTPRFTPNPPVRASLQNLLPAENEFETLLNHLLPLDVPLSFIEGFDNLQAAAERSYPSSPKAIFSSAAWYFDEAFKQWAAFSAEHGARLLGIQHGGNYGSLAHHPIEEHEITITDRYYTWGWQGSRPGARVTPWFAAKLAGRKPLHAADHKAGILFVATSMPRYLLQLPHTPDHFHQYLLWQSRFLAAINPPLLAMVRVRFHQADLGWEIAQRWRDAYPEIQLDTWETPFLKSLENCRLYVCDQLGTTFLEALSADKPTILFWDPVINQLRPEAQPYYDRLRAAGILHDNPEAAAQAVNVVYEDVAAWWNNPLRQTARAIFCDNFARTSSNAVNEWTDEFKRIVNNS